MFSVINPRGHAMRARLLSLMLLGAAALLAGGGSRAEAAPVLRPALDLAPMVVTGGSDLQAQPVQYSRRDEFRRREEWRRREERRRREMRRRRHGY